MMIIQMSENRILNKSIIEFSKYKEKNIFIQFLKTEFEKNLKTV